MPRVEAHVPKKGHGCTCPHVKKNFTCGPRIERGERLPYLVRCLHVPDRGGVCYEGETRSTEEKKKKKTQGSSLTRVPDQKKKAHAG